MIAKKFEVPGLGVFEIRAREKFFEDCKTSLDILNKFAAICKAVELLKKAEDYLPQNETAEYLWKDAYRASQNCGISYKDLKELSSCRVIPGEST